jgi:pantothenate synthetase
MCISPPTQRAQSTVLYKSLQRAKALIEAGERDAKRVIAEMERVIATASEAKIDYIEIVARERSAAYREARRAGADRAGGLLRQSEIDR